jgi:haloalkane dehalogenase
MDILRTPEERFSNLNDWAYGPGYIDDLEGYGGMRAHYVDVGPKEAEHTFLCLHGEPTWAYLYRHMIPVFLESGARVVAPDFFGFGRSDKPVNEATYSFHFHRNYLLRLIERLDLNNITLVCQDWGGLLGLTLPVDMPERFSRLLVMNTTIATGTPAGPGFDAWRAYCAKTPDLPIGGLLGRSTPHLTPREIAAYDAPFPDASYKAGARAFPQIVMTEPGMEGVETSKKAVRFWSGFTGKSFMAIGMADPVLGATAMQSLRKVINGCPQPMEITEGGHFVQEWGGDIARAALKSFDS